MTRGPRIILGLLAALAVAWLVSIPVRGWYIARHRDLTSDITQYRQAVDAWEGDLIDRPRVRGEIEGYVNRTLGDDLETLDHALRSRLNRLGEGLELDDLVVSTGKSRSMPSPARSVFSGRTQKSLRDEVDFVELEAWITGRGSLDQVLQLVGEVRAAPWIKRIEQVRLEPKDGGAVVDVNLRFTTFYLPGRSPGDPPERAADDPVQFAARNVILERDPFRIPASKPAPPPAPPPGDGARPPAFPYHQWLVTGVAIGPAGAGEVWLLDTQGDRSLILPVGGTIGALTLSSVEGEQALFTSGDASVEVRVGDRLRAR